MKELLDTSIRKLDAKWGSPRISRRIDQLAPEKKILTSQDMDRYLEATCEQSREDVMLQTTFNHFIPYIGTFYGLYSVPDEGGGLRQEGAYTPGTPDIIKNKPNRKRSPKHSPGLCDLIAGVINRKIMQDTRVKIYDETPRTILRLLNGPITRRAFSLASFLQIPLLAENGNALTGSIIIYRFGERPIPESAREFGEFISAPLGEAIMKIR